MGDAGIHALTRWLAQQALCATPAPGITTHVAEALSALGLPLWRLHVGLSALLRRSNRSG